MLTNAFNGKIFVYDDDQQQMSVKVKKPNLKKNKDQQSDNEQHNIDQQQDNNQQKNE